MSPRRIEHDMNLEKDPRRLAIVTGASRQRGIGAAVCRALARAGVDIFFTHWSAYDRKMLWGPEEDTPAQLQRQLRGMGVRCEQLMVDLSLIDTPQLIMNAVVSQLGPASILVNNATY